MTQENAVFPTPLPTISGSTPQATYNDPSLSGYWHLWGSTGGTRGANVVKMWDDYRGSGVIVGVIDDGVDYNHPELAGNYASSLDYDGRDGDADAYPSDPTDMHGTTVAGVIAAALNNSAGGAGVAPEASIAGFRIGFGSNGTDQQVLDAFQWMAAVDIANNSWGFGGFLEDSFLYPGFAPIRNALQNALDVGRSGLGTIVVFSAGNGRTSGQDVNYHGFQNNRGIIAAAATDSAGNVTWFSTPGAALLVAAPGQSVPTTDRLGASGYSNGDYATMSGTSFSAPIVSGVAALMLDANPGLGWRDVQEILAATAVQTGATTGWSLNGADNWNGGPMHVSYDYGFGLVDAFAAVRVAESWRGVSTSRNESVTSGAASGPVAIPDVGSLSRTITLPQNLRIDHVEVDVFLTHANIGQLQITLTAPDGTQSLLFHNPATSQADIAFTFSTTRDWGEFSAGDWTLTIADTQSGASGILTNWTLRAYGDAPGNDTYVYTDEFSVLAPADPGRRVLSDLGGTDNVNTASIASDTLLDLRPGYSSSIDGQTVVISAGTVIENADTGDGNDVLIGNDAANSLRGWRGNDLLDGGPGADTLEGGVGDDVYVVESAGDVLVEAATGGNDTVRTALPSYGLGTNLENLIYLGTGDFAGVGNSAANLIGGGAGNDTLDGGFGADTLSGGAGSDQYVVDSPGDSIIENVNEGIDLVVTSITYALGANVENLLLTSLAAINGTGNELDNTLFSGAGNNVLDGGSGTDTASYAYATGTVSVSLGIAGAQTTGASGTDTLLRIENLYGSAFNDKLTGDATANVIEGGSGSDTIDGVTGADTMLGGNGSDIYHVNNVGDIVTEANADPVVGGIDIVYSSLPSYTLTSHVEKLRLVATGAANGTGNSLDNSLFAGPGDNVLDGGGGTDTLSYFYATGPISVSLAVVGPQITGASGRDTLISIENLYGGSFNDNLAGDARANRLDGGAGADALFAGPGADTLFGGTGADTMTGGDGSDNYYVDDPGDQVAETNAVLATGGNDTVYSYLPSYVLTSNIESLQILASGTASGTGNSLDNWLYAGHGDNVLDGGSGTDSVLYSFAVSAVSVSLATDAAQATGGSGNDTLRSVENVYGSSFNDILTGSTTANTIDGGVGADTMLGGNGSDTYRVDNAGDIVTETNADAAIGGVDIVYSSLPSYTLTSHVEKLRLVATGAANGTGNSLDNSLFAGPGDNVLDGGGGTDTLSYFYATGPVSVSLAAVGPQITGASGRDTLLSIENLYGGSFDDSLAGDASANRLDGGAGADSLVGHGGDDILVGGVGSDTFVFATNFGNDRINDFTPGQDHIQLILGLGFTDFSALDTNADGTLGYGDANVKIAGPDTFIDFDTDQLRIVGYSALQSSDFIFS